MGHLQVQSVCRYPLLLVVLVVCLTSGAFAQQQYDRKEGYFCSDSGKKNCTAFALYRAQQSYSDVRSIAKLFGASATTVARLSNVTVNSTLTYGQAVIIPLNCRCGSNSSSYANVSYTIVDGDTFYQVNIGNFESLSTTTAVLAANSQLQPTNLTIGQKIAFPVRCACPSKAQLSNEVTALVTYPVVNLDNVDQIGADFGVPSQDILDANELQGPNAKIEVATTLLVPINSSQPSYVARPPVPSSTPGSSPSPSPGSPSSDHKSSNKTGVYVAIAVGVCVAVLALVAFGACCLLGFRRRKRKERIAARKDGTQAPLVTGTGGIGNSPGVLSSSDLTSKRESGDPLAGMSDLVDADKPTLFSYDELCDATNNFSDGSRLQGSVYRGVLRGQVIAIKQMKGNMSEELKILCRVHHTNLVRLVGLCMQEPEYLYLVYEYAENGSLSDCLHTDFLSRNKMNTRSSSYLSWTMRVQIGLDAASGLEYIHDYVNPGYVHKDVKSSNILLDGAFRARIANFAMARSGGNIDMMTRHIAGTYGYMAPEYLAHGLVSTKADVFSFGVVLLELLSGNEAITEDTNGEERCLYSSIKPILESADPAAKFMKWADPVLEKNYPLDTALEMAQLAKACVDTDPSVRPNMKDITFTLSKLLNASLEWESSSVFASTLADTPIEAR